MSFWPRRAPEDNAIVRFPVISCGQMLEVEIGIDNVKYTLREGECLVIRHETEEIQRTPEQPLGRSAAGKNEIMAVSAGP
jgi:alpha,alpha-trehalose phosphorylase